MFPGRFLASCVLLPFVMTTAAIAAPQTLRDVEYARLNGASLRLDAWLPHTPGRAPAAIIVHGGAWVTGDRRASVQPLFHPLESAGIAWFSISYRLATDLTQFGVAVDDVQAAIRFVKSHAAEYEVDPDRIALIGESAGGQLAAMAALRQPGAVKAVVALYAPTDLVTLAKTSSYVPKSMRDSIRGTPFEGLVLAGLAQLSPLNNVRPGMPPFLFIHGTDDALVPFQQSVEMCNRMRTAGASCEVYAVSGGGHGIRWWEAYPSLAAPYKAKMIAWLKDQFALSPSRKG